MNNYDDIINLPHHESKKYNRMPIINRAAQFAPFAALTGYEEAIEETGRLTTDRKEIDEYLKVEINNKLNILISDENVPKDVEITFFVPNLRKEGGEYVSKKGVVTKVDNNRKIVIVDNESIDIENIIRIEFCEWVSFGELKKTLFAAFLTVNSVFLF